MAYQITFEKEDGEQVVVNLDDLSPDVFARIAREEKDAGLTYWGVYAFPKESPDICYKVICAAAEHAGVDPPERADTMRAMFEQNAMFSDAPDILKQPAQGGLPPVPSETEVGSSSTSLGPPTTGPQVSPDESQSETS